MEKVTYTPAEFAKVFGRERTWAYRQLYAGKVQAITEFGRTQIPKSEVDRMLKEAGRYLGAKAKPDKRKSSTAVAAKKAVSSRASKSWADTIKQRKTRGLPRPENDRCADARKPSKPEPRRRDAQASERQSVYQRLTRYKSSQKSAEDHDE